MSFAVRAASRSFPTGQAPGSPAPAPLPGPPAAGSSFCRSPRKRHLLQAASPGLWKLGPVMLHHTSCCHALLYFSKHLSPPRILFGVCINFLELKEQTTTNRLVKATGSVYGLSLEARSSISRCHQGHALFKGPRKGCPLHLPSREGCLPSLALLGLKTHHSNPSFVVAWPSSFLCL